MNAPATPCLLEGSHAARGVSVRHYLAFVFLETMAELPYTARVVSLPGCRSSGPHGASPKVSRGDLVVLSSPLFSVHGSEPVANSVFHFFEFVGTALSISPFTGLLPGKARKFRELSKATLLGKCIPVIASAALLG